MQTEQGTELMVFGWLSEEPQGGMRDFLGVTSNLNEPWELARIHDIVDIMNNGDWEWTVDCVEAYNAETYEPVSRWWVNPKGTWVESQ